jgi:hypothetical protein
MLSEHALANAPLDPAKPKPKNENLIFYKTAPFFISKANIIFLKIDRSIK